ncbi:MAG: hypothetical protein ACI91O_000766 [Candidatus Poriferisodalaceae bacterium]|jgi:hypothetical protein
MKRMFDKIRTMGTTSLDSAGGSEITLDELEGRLTSQAARNAANMHEYLVTLEEFDRRKGWVGDGVRSFGHWLNWKIGTGVRVAQDQLRVAKALTVLPVTSEAFSRGELSYSRVRAITRVALPETEVKLVGIAKISTGSQLDKYVKALITIGAQDDPTPVRAPELSRRGDDDGREVFTLKCDPADGELVWKAVHAAVVQDSDKNLDERRADAFVAIADSYLANGPTDRSGSDRTQIVMHTHAESDVATLTDGTVLDHPTRRRLECEASHITLNSDADGNETPGRNTSGISERLRRTLMLRDRHCRWPGCSAEHHIHAHHVIHRTEDGPTVLENLVLLCGHHHRVLHAEGYNINRNADRTWTFLRPDGTVIAPRPLQMAAPRNAQPPLPSRFTIVSKWDGSRLIRCNINPIPILKPNTPTHQNSDHDEQLPETG